MWVTVQLDDQITLLVFYWFLSGLEWIPNLEGFFTKTFDILPEIIMEYQT